MSTGKCTLIAFLLLVSAVQVGQAQQTPAPSPAPSRSAVPSPFEESVSQPAVYYRLDLVIREKDGENLVDTRTYSLWVQSGVQGDMAAGSDVPYQGSSYTTGTGVTKNTQYRSVGISIYCLVKEENDGPMLNLKLNISDALPPEKDSNTPAFRNVTINARALLTLGKSTTVNIVEDPGSRHRFQVDVTATKLK